jgi:hypothetical protein
MWGFEKAPLNRCIAATRINIGCFRERFRNMKRFTFCFSALEGIWLSLISSGVKKDTTGNCMKE